MTGYFDVKTYCELTGTSEMTVYKRKERKQIPYILGVDGKYYMFYTDENAPVDGYVSIRDYSIIHNVNYQAVRTAIDKNRFKENEVIRCKDPKKQGRFWHYYILKDAEYPKFDFAEHAKTMSENNHKKYIKSCPYDEGYITLREWADLNNVLISTTRIYAYRGIIPSKRVNGHVYISKDYVHQFKKGIRRPE